jgi:hypothetical protein
MPVVDEVLVVPGGVGVQGPRRSLRIVIRAGVVANDVPEPGSTLRGGGPSNSPSI